MKRTLLAIGFVVANFAFAQLKKVELNNDELQFIAESRTSSMLSEPNEGITNKILELNNTLYYFEIVQNDKILYIDGYSLWNPYSMIGQETYRNKRTICFKYNNLSNDTILKMLENGKWRTQKTGNSKFICNRDFQIIIQNSNDKKFYPAKYEDGLEVKFYKIVE